MKILPAAIVILFISFSVIKAQTYYPSYYHQNEFSLTSPGAMKYGLYGYNNPALLGVINQYDLYFAWSDKYGKWSDLNNWGLFTAVPHFGFSAVNLKVVGYSVTDYKLSLGFGNSSLSYGIGYGWSAGDAGTFHRSDVFTVGTLIRPYKYISLGLIGNISTKYNSSGIVDFALRPFGTEAAALFGDYLLGGENIEGEPKWSAGCAFELLPGIRITGRYFDTKFFNIGAEFSLGRIGFTAATNFDKNSNHTYNIYGVRVGGYDRNILSKILPEKKYVSLDLLGNIEYQRYLLFDNSNTLINLIEQIDAAKEDKTIAGIAVNTSGMKVNKEILWELREKLKHFKEAGKHVVVFIDRTNIDGYQFASVADKIVMDPQGMLTLEGYLMGRTFYKNTLAKLGIGFDELRYFKYKSAMESFSRTEMSKADSLQRQQLVDEFYNLAKHDICGGRGITTAYFDSLVNYRVAFLPEEAVKAGLIDTIGRWDAVTRLIKEFEKEKPEFTSAGELERFLLPNDDHWGRKPEIAVIYAIGTCAMDYGITARKLVKDVERAAGDPNIKAVILRVDSPGGDGMASDIIAEAIKKCKQLKPVIVSQGFVAASGGYWLSMYADTIVAAPNTITGSIGVIGGWFYDNGLKEKLGFSTDYVKRGDHADLGFGFTLPFIGLPALPDRDFTPSELKKVKSSILTMYREFVNKAASGRDTTYDYIASIAQGRVWSGSAGLKNYLVDVLGGLSRAINIAAVKAGLDKDEYRIAEYPAQKLFSFSQFIPGVFGPENKNDNVLNHLRFRMNNNGLPMPLLPLSDMNYILNNSFF